MKENILLSIYLLGALATNSYTREFRYDDWKNKSQSKEDAKSADATVYCFFATVGWPIYGTVLISDKIVHTIAYSKVEVEKPEILK
jgi:hypothetical protein